MRENGRPVAQGHRPPVPVRCDRYGLGVACGAHVTSLRSVLPVSR